MISRVRQQLVSAALHCYPLYSGCGRIANLPLVRALAGNGAGDVWARTRSGHRLRVPIDDFVGRAIYYTGDLDPKVSWVCKRVVRRGDLVLDIGANLGLVTVLLSKLVGPDGAVHSFEPNPRMVALLEQTLSAGGLRNVTLHPVALGETEARLPLHVSPMNAGASSLVATGSAADGTTVEVPVRPLDKELAGVTKPIRLIKIDVEGFELDVLRGALPVLRQRLPDAIIFEHHAHGSGGGQHPVIRLLAELGYKFFAVPQALLRMRVFPYDPDADGRVAASDLVAVPGDERYPEIGRLLRAF